MDDFAPSYNDPVRDRLDDLEWSVESFVDPESTMLGPPTIDEMDGLGRILGNVEGGIEGRTVPPPDVFVAEPGPTMPLGPDLAHGGPRSPDPPPPPESPSEPMTSVLAPQAARPFLVEDGLVPARYDPQFGGSTGIGDRRPVCCSAWRSASASRGENRYASRSGFKNGVITAWAAGPKATTRS